MEKEVKGKALKILSKLYLSISCIIVLTYIALCYGSIMDEFKRRDAFNQAHTNLEVYVGYTPDTSKLSLLEARELIGLESDSRLRRSFDDTFNTSDNKTHTLIDSACFSFNHSLAPIESGCRKIGSYWVGHPYQTLFESIAWVFGVILALFMIRKWSSWLIK